MSNTQKKGVTGFLSGWSTYSTDTSNAAAGTIPEKFSVAELLVELRRIKRDFDPKVLEKFVLLVEGHIHDEANPHNTTLESLNTTVIAELYAVWQEDGYTGTIDDFKKVLFQYVEIADVDTTLAGTDPNKLVSVAGAKALYEDHISDLNAHDEMFRHIFPGSALDIMPTFSAQAFIDIPDNLTVERASSIIAHSPIGYFEEVPADTMAIDHLYSNPAYSIWGERTNMVRHSASLGTCSFTGGGVFTIINNVTPNRDKLGVVFIEDETGETSTHGFESETLSFQQGHAYTVSTYVLPMDKRYFSLALPTTLGGSEFYPVHDLMGNEESYVPYGYNDTMNSAEAVVLPNEWVKVSLSFVAQATMSAKVYGLFSDVIDGDMTYIGTGEQPGALYQLQIEQGLGASPPIFTEDLIVTRPATVVKLPFVDFFNDRAGALVITTKKPVNLTLESERYLYELGNVSEGTLYGKYEVLHNLKLTMGSYNLSRDVLDTDYSGDAERDETTYVHAYDMREHTYGNTGDDATVKSITDDTVSVANVLDYMMSDIYGSAGIVGAEVVNLDIENPIVSSESTISSMTDTEILEYTITALYSKTKEDKSSDDLAIIDLPEEGELSVNSTLNDAADFLFIGCNRAGEKQLNGYIFDITYYSKYVTLLETEFLTGEYVHGE